MLLGKTLTLSATITPSASNNGAVRVFFWNGTTEISKINPDNLTSSGSITFTVPDEYPSGSTGIVITFSSNANGTAVANDYTDYTNVMLVEGSTAVTTYEDYVAPTTYPLSLGTLEFAKIGDYRDRLFRANDSGKWYKYNNIGNMQIDGSKTWILGTNSSTGYTYFYSASYDDIIGAKTYLLYSNCFGQSTTRITPAYVTNKPVISATATSTDTYKIRILCPNSIATTVPNFKTWLNNNKPVIYYDVQTPSAIEITDTTLINQLEAIHLATGVNVIEFQGNTLVSQLDVNYIGEASPHL